MPFGLFAWACARLTWRPYAVAVIGGPREIARGGHAEDSRLIAGRPLLGRLLVHDALRATWRELAVRPDPGCAVCAPGRAFPGYIDYAAFCAHRG